VRSRASRTVFRAQGGAASVELLGALPLLGLALLAAAQFALAGGALWAAAISARAGARAAAVGGDGHSAATRALPPALRKGATISGRDGVRVRVRVPALVPGLPRIEVGARSTLGAGGGGG
jgi:hypothetical protein